MINLLYDCVFVFVTVHVNIDTIKTIHKHHIDIALRDFLSDISQFVRRFRRVSIVSRIYCNSEY